MLRPLGLSTRRGRVVVVLAALVILASLLSLAPATSAGAPAAFGAEGGGEPAGDRRVIVELDDAPLVTALPSAMRAGGTAARSGSQVYAARDRLQDAQAEVVEAARSGGLEVVARRSLTDLINGISATVATKDIDELRALPGVRAVHLDQQLRASTDTSVPLIGAPEVWETEDPQGNPARGTGSTVAVIDTGVDYTNDSLGGAFGPGHKVVAGHDYVNGDNDPKDDNGHGTHVAGIIAGNGPITGVAPDATITAYKVLNDIGNGWESDIIAALQAAISPTNPDRADVVNMSLGGPGDGTDPIGRAATAATQTGAVVVVSAGNSGPAAQTVGSPGAADGVLTVGASASGVRLPVASIVTPKRDRLQFYRAPYSANPPAQPVTGDLVDVGAGNAVDYDRVGDVQGKVVAYRAVLPQSLADVQPQMLEKARLAEDRGAIGLIAYQSGGGPVLAAEGGSAIQSASGTEPGVVDVPLRGARSGDSFRMDRVIVLAIDRLQWAEITGYLAQGAVRIELSGEDITDSIASFSSRGPTSRFTLKPDVVAPGVEIQSAWPTAQWAPGIYRISGTSMAAPHAAGAAALLRQLRPTAAGERLSAALIGSANGLGDLGAATQGAGRIDVASAARAKVTASPPVLSLGLADLSRPDIDGGGSVSLHNDGPAAVDVTLRADKASGSPGTVKLSKTRVTIPANGDVAVKLDVRAARPDRDTDVGGWVVADLPAGTPDVRVPYLLAARTLIVQTSPDPSDGTGEVFVYSPTALSRPPVVTLTPRHGKPTTVATRHDHDAWYRGALTGKKPGAYRVAASADALTGQRLLGAGAWEVVAADNKPGGDRWSPVGPNGDAGNVVTAPGDPDTAVANQYTKAGPWVTDDHGATWEQRTRLPVAGGTGATVIDARKPGRMWYAVNANTAAGTRLDPTYQGKILRSDDRGRTWRTLDAPNVHYYGLVSDPETRTLVAATSDALLVSRDAGDNWTSYATGLGVDLTAVEVGGQDVFLSTLKGVWAVRGVIAGEPTGMEQVHDANTGRVDGMVADSEIVAFLNDKDRIIGSRDGGTTWQEMFAVPNGGAWSLHMDKGTMLISLLRAENYVGRDHGQTWVSVPAPVNGAIESDLADWGDGSMLMSSGRAGLFRTDADGRQPQRIGVQGLTVYDLAVTANATGGPTLLAGTDSDTYRTALPTGAVTPQTAEWGLSGKEAFIGTRIPQLAISPSQPSTVWKIRHDATGAFWVYRSDDGGATWEQRARDNQLTYDMAVGPTDPDRVAISFATPSARGLFVTRNAGTTWKKLLHDDIFTAVTADPANPDRLWLGSSRGLFRSDDFGTHVTQVLTGRVTSVTVAGSLVVAGGESIRWSDNGGQTFHDADTGGLPLWVTEIVAAPGKGKTLYAATTTYSGNGLVKGGRGILRSTDGGRTWANVSGGLQNLSAESLAVSRDGRWLFAGTVNGGVHRLRLD